MRKNTRILIVDDQKDLREQLARLLRNAGKSGETASLVKHMRDRLLGRFDAQNPADADDDPTYDVDTAGQGKDGYEMVVKALEERKPYAIVFLDMRMPPGWDGLETAKKMRQSDKNIEIVIMTAYADHDQKTINEQVGVPEKLLYLKKPFQTEEIYQLALSLTAKWTAEEQSRNKGIWLEKLVRSMSKIQYSTALTGEDFFGAVLQALTDFTDTSRGFITSAAPEGWRILSVHNVERPLAETYVKDHNDRLKSLITTQSYQGQYLLPLKKDKFFGVAVFYDANNANEPEWFKLLSLLLMTASHSLRNYTARENEPVTAAKVQLKLIHDGVDKIKESATDKEGIAKLIAAVKELENIVDSLVR